MNGTKCGFVVGGAGKAGRVQAGHIVRQPNAYPKSGDLQWA